MPKAFSASSKARVMAERSSTSAPTAMARRPACSIRVFTAASRSARRATRTTAAPALANAFGETHAKPARRAGDECHPPGEIEELGCAHPCGPQVVCPQKRSGEPLHHHFPDVFRFIFAGGKALRHGRLFSTNSIPVTDVLRQGVGHGSHYHHDQHPRAGGGARPLMDASAAASAAWPHSSALIHVRDRRRACAAARSRAPAQTTRPRAQPAE